MNKIGLITHIADPDGAFPIILAKLVFDDIDVFSVEVSDVDKTLEGLIEKQEDYKHIYIVDVNMSTEMAGNIDKDVQLREKILVFDHHVSNLSLNQYSFISVVDERNGHKECGTSLFYEYLKETYSKEVLYKESLCTMIEFVRENDTFDFVDSNKEKAIAFRSLYDIYGRERYIEHYYQYILANDTFFFTETEELLITLNQEKTAHYVEEKLEHVIFATIEKMRVGIVFAEQNRSVLGHAMAEKLDIDIAIVINVDRSISYRADKEDVDVTTLASLYGGGGHKHAGGSPLPKDLQEKIVSYLFQNVEWK